MTLTKNVICRNCGEEEGSSCHILLHCPLLARHGSAWLNLKDIRSASFKMVLALALR
jgi:hypothetical protein